jgi:hypothetical protein
MGSRRGRAIVTYDVGSSYATEQRVDRMLRNAYLVCSRRVAKESELSKSDRRETLSIGARTRKTEDEKRRCRRTKQQETHGHERHTLYGNTKTVDLVEVHMHVLIVWPRSKTRVANSLVMKTRKLWC